MTGAQARPETQLYLVTPPVEDVARFLPVLTEVLSAGDVACVLLNLVASDDNAAKKAVRDIAAPVQKANVALILASWIGIAAKAGADGVHVTGNRADLREALESFKPERIVGVGGV